MIREGSVVQNHRVEELLGEGAMGKVYRGVDLMLKREEAIKVIRPDIAREARFEEWFRTEAMAMGSLSHPNVPTVYSLIREEDELLLIMELLRGKTLDKVIKAEGPMPWGRALPLFTKVLDGIEEAHKRDIVHRDIKPANIFLTEDGAIKVMDFGIARMAGEDMRTRTGYMVGTLKYMAPEQVRGEAVDPRADIYALGIVLYEILTGRVPFEGSQYDLIRMQVEATPPPPMSLVPNLPSHLNDAILCALKKKRSERFQTVGELREAVLTKATRRSPPEPGPTVVSRRTRSTNGFWFFAIVVGMGITVGSILFLLSDRGTAPSPSPATSTVGVTASSPTTVRPTTIRSTSTTRASSTIAATSTIPDAAAVTPTLPAEPPYEESYEVRDGVQFDIEEEADVEIWDPAEEAEPRPIGKADDWDGRWPIGKTYRFSKPGTYYARFTLSGHRPTWVRIIVSPHAKKKVVDIETKLKKS